MESLLLSLLCVPTLVRATCADDVHPIAMNAAIESVQNEFGPDLRPTASVLERSVDGHEMRVEVSWLDSRGIVARRYEQRMWVLLNGDESVSIRATPRVESPLVISASAMRRIAQSVVAETRAAEVFAHDGLSATVLIENGEEATLIQIQDLKLKGTHVGAWWKGDLGVFQKAIHPRGEGQRIESVLLTSADFGRSIAVVRFENAPAELFEVEFETNGPKAAKFIGQAL